MVLNLCLPHFHTSVHCNKLCADGYEVTNLVSGDPDLRRRGFKLEYFLRPPVQVTLKFDFQVELCRVDVELWPWGMDRGQACKRLEISTCSDQSPCENTDQRHVQQNKQMQLKDQTEQKRGKQNDIKSLQCNGHQWSLQAQQWGEQSVDESQQRGHAFKPHPNTESSDTEPEFKVVGRCELREETRICFNRKNYYHRPPFLSPPPTQPANCRQEELWSRGLLSLGAVTQLRVTLPYGGSASALGLKALVVWGQPARCCPTEEVERIKNIHEANQRQLPKPVLFSPSVSQKKQPSQAATSLSNLSIPEEFLDPITQEVMKLPMLLPSGMSVDNSTLEEHQKREATWGRPPNDPFTGVPFTSTSQPLPNPQLKSRIDLFLLQKGIMGKDGMLGRQSERENPQVSRLLASRVDGESQKSLHHEKNSIGSIVVNCNAGNRNSNGSGHLSENAAFISSSQCVTTEINSEFEGRKKRDRNELTKEPSSELTTEKQPVPQMKRPRTAVVTVSSCSSHEQRLSASLDEALFTALQGRPSFTKNLCQQKPVTPDSEPLRSMLQGQTAGIQSMKTGEKMCSLCSCSISVYSKSASCIYRLTCGHLLCGSCLRRKSEQLNSVTGSSSNHVLCPCCQSPSSRSDITRVHH